MGLVMSLSAVTWRTSLVTLVAFSLTLSHEHDLIFKQTVILCVIPPSLFKVLNAQILLLHNIYTTYCIYKVFHMN